MKKIRVSFEEFQSSLDAGKNALFLLSLSEQTDNELRLVLCGSKTGEAEKRKKIPPENPVDRKLQELLAGCRPILPDTANLWEVIIDRYILYQVRNESFYSDDTQEAGSGNYIISFEKSKLLDYLSVSTIASAFSDGSYFPYKWKHHGIYTQNHVIDVISDGAPEIYRYIV